MTAPAARQTILVVDPDPDFLDWAQHHLAAPSIEIAGATSAEEAHAVYAKNPADLAIIELRLGPDSGMKLLQNLRQQNPNAMAILTTGFPPTSAIIEAMKFGAYEFLPKETLTHELRSVVENALKTKEALDAENTGEDALGFPGRTEQGALYRQCAGHAGSVQDGRPGFAFDGARDDNG